MKVLVLLGVLGAFSGVALGAFGAHGLRRRLSPESLAVFQTGVTYQMMHSLALLMVFLLVANGNQEMLLWAGRLFVAGIVLFSGSLYLMAVTGKKRLGAITPVGGLCFLAGWLALGVGLWRG